MMQLYLFRKDGNIIGKQKNKKGNLKRKNKGSLQKRKSYRRNKKSSN